MVRLTEAAVSLLEDKRRQNQIPRSHGLRIYGRADFGDGPMARLALAFVPRPEKGDLEVEEQGIHLYVSPEVTDSLQSLVIDAGGEQWAQLEIFAYKGPN